MKFGVRRVESRAALLCAVAVFVWSGSALAFCRAMSCELGEKETDPCPRDENKCVTKGKPLHWASPCLTYTVQVDGSPKYEIDADAVQAFVAQAFEAWKTARCPGGGSPRFEAQFAGYVSCDRREAICENADKNDNVIMFHDSGWLEGATRIGVTTPTGGKESGLVVDADVEINSQDFRFENSPSGMPTSLRYVLTHELGHFLGLAHSSVSDSVMSLSYQSRPLSSNLISADDAAAICAVFPPGPPLSCGSAQGPAYDQCQIPLGEHPPCQLVSMSEVASCGCRLAQSSGAPRTLTWGALGVMFGALGARRLSGRRRRPRPYSDA